MDRAEYNACMSPYIRGKGKPKEERRLNFCIGAKLCSGKVKDKAEAEKICRQPKMPKWAKQELPEETQETCPVRMTRTGQNIDIITLKVKEGEAREVLGLGAQVLSDFIHCRAESEAIPLVEEAVNDLKGLSKRYYLKGESKDLQNKLNIIKSTLEAE